MHGDAEDLYIFLPWSPRVYWILDEKKTWNFEQVNVNVVETKLVICIYCLIVFKPTSRRVTSSLRSWFLPQSWQVVTWSSWGMSSRSWYERDWSWLTTTTLHKFWTCAWGQSENKAYRQRWELVGRVQEAGYYHSAVVVIIIRSTTLYYALDTIIHVPWLHYDLYYLTTTTPRYYHALRISTTLLGLSDYFCEDWCQIIVEISRIGSQKCFTHTMFGPARGGLPTGRQQEPSKQHKTRTVA
jgi:hypothetical protein